MKSRKWKIANFCIFLSLSLSCARVCARVKENPSVPILDCKICQRDSFRHWFGIGSIKSDECFWLIEISMSINLLAPLKWKFWCELMLQSIFMIVALQISFCASSWCEFFQHYSLSDAFRYLIKSRTHWIEFQLWFSFLSNFICTIELMNFNSRYSFIVIQ